MNARTNRWVIAAAVAALILGAILSRVVEPGVRVEKVTLAENTPAPLNSARAGNKRFIYNRQKDDPNA